MSDSATPEGWNPIWEDGIYSKGNALNRYPYDAVVSYVYSRFGGAADRSAIRILEIGCGAGNNLWFAAREGFAVAGIDGSQSAIDFLRDRFAQEELAGDFRVGDFVQLDWSDETFDLVLDRGAITCNRRAAIQSALDEANRVLKPGGRLYSVLYSADHADRAFGQPFGDGSYDDFSDGLFVGHGTVFFATPDDIRALHGARFELQQMVKVSDDDFLNDLRRVSAWWHVEGRKG